MMKYKHALFLNPYVESTTTGVMRAFPPTGLEYVATSAKDLVGKITLLDLRYEEDFCDSVRLLDFIKKEIDYCSLLNIILKNYHLRLPATDILLLWMRLILPVKTILFFRL